MWLIEFFLRKFNQVLGFLSVSILSPRLFIDPPFQNRFFSFLFFMRDVSMTKTSQTPLTGTHIRHLQKQLQLLIRSSKISYIIHASPPFLLLQGRKLGISISISFQVGFKEQVDCKNFWDYVSWMIGAMGVIMHKYSRCGVSLAQ